MGYPKMLYLGGLTQVVNSAEEEQQWTHPPQTNPTPDAPKAIPPGVLSPSLRTKTKRKPAKQARAPTRKGAKKR